LCYNKVAPNEQTKGFQMKLLIVEDNQDIAEGLTGLLEQHDHTVSHVVNGALALEELSRSDFDAIISDVNMPTMDGLTFSVLARENGLQAPIILFTGESDLDPKMLQDGRISAVFGKMDITPLIKAINKMGAK